MTIREREKVPQEGQVQGDLAPESTFPSCPLPLMLAVLRSSRLSLNSRPLSRSLATLVSMSGNQSYPRPPTSPPSWTHSPASIKSTIAASIATTTDLLSAIAAIPQAQRTFESVVRPLALRNGEESREVEPAVFVQYVSGDKDVRDAAVEGDKELQVRALDLEGVRCSS